MLERGVMHDQRHHMGIVQFLVRLQRRDRHPVERKQREDQKESERQPQPQRAHAPAAILDHHALLRYSASAMISSASGGSMASATEAPRPNCPPLMAMSNA